MEIQSYNTPALIIQPSLYLVHIYTMKEHQYLHFVLQAHCLAPPLQVLRLATFQLYDTIFFYFVFIQSINASLKRVWFVLMKHCVLLDFKQNIFKWYLDAGKKLLFTMKTITFMYQIEKSWNNRIGVKKLCYVIHGFLFSVNANAFQCI